MKKVSVILTTYNSGKAVESTVQSIVSQDGIGKAFDLELLVVDDCSVDNTVNILRNMDVKVYSTETNSGGPNKGRNIGLKKATGDYICITDHDDLWEKHRIISLLPYLEKAPIVTSGFTIIDTTRNKRITRVKSSETGYIHYPRNETFLKKLTKSLYGQNTYLSSIMFRKELQHILFEETFGAVDFDWILRLFHKNASIEVCDSLYTRLVKDSNLSMNPSYRTMDFYYSLMTIEAYEDLYPEAVRIAYRKIHGSRARYFYMTGNMKKARFHFLKSSRTLKNLMYYLTTYAGSGYVKKRFNVFS